jgi:quinoprotein glucose dehydrogenase
MTRLAAALAGAAVVAIATAPRVLTQSKSTSKPPAPSNEWPTYGHDAGGQRFSPLTQITPANVGQLQVAWVYHMRPAPPAAPVAAATGARADSAAVGEAPPAQQGRGRGRGRGSGFVVSETTPIVIDGVMYISSPYGRVVALDSSTGKELWVFQVPNGVPSTRGVEYWPGDAKTAPQIVFGTNDGRLFSLHARTGEPNEAFGAHGIVNLNTPEILQDLPGNDGLGSPPTV